MQENFKKVLISLLTGLMCLFYITTYAATTANNSNGDNRSYLFVQTAGWATLTPQKTPGVYTLTLHDVTPYLTYFTDRPNRITGIISTEKFLQLTQKNFSEDAPNVGIEGTKMIGMLEHNRQVNVVMTLSNPVFSADKKEVSLTAKSVTGNAIDLKHKIFFKNVSLFIDNVAGICFSCVH